MTTLFAVSALAALSALPSVAAQCDYYRYGRCYRRNGLANGARIGIGIAVAAAFVVLLMLMLCLRRRKVHKANIYYAQQQQQMGQTYQPPHQNGLQGAFFPTYQNPNQQGMFNKHSRNEEDVQPPPPAYNPTANGATGAQQSYAPPAGPPPGQQDNSVEAREWREHQENLRQQNANRA